MPARKIEIAPSAPEIIDRLKRKFRVNTSGEVPSRAIALADEAMPRSDVIVLAGEAGVTKIDLSQ